MHRTKHLLTAVVVVMALGFICACRQQVGDRTGSAKLQTTVMDAQRGILKGTYKDFGQTVEIEARRGAAIPAEEQDPGEPPYQIDVVFTSEQGDPFLVQAGGHGLHESTWGVFDENPEIGLGRRTIDFQLATAAADALESISIPDGLEWERRALVKLVRAADKDDALYHNDDEHVVPDDDEPTTESEGGGMLNLKANFNHAFQIRKKPAGPGSIDLGLADHSAMYAWVRNSSGTRVSQMYTCNHGACASASSMSTKCTSRNVTRTTSLLPLLSTCPLNHEDYSCTTCCDTDYGIIPDDGRHVCNDDTSLERDLMLYTGGTCWAPTYCGDTALARYAPSCG